MLAVFRRSITPRTPYNHITTHKSYMLRMLRMLRISHNVKHTSIMINHPYVAFGDVAKLIVNSRIKLDSTDDHPVMIINGDKYWYSNGDIHREGDKPAIEYANGDKEWRYNGDIHREGDKPAIVCANGDKYWFYKNQCHREGNRPAVELANGDKKWYYHGRLHREGGKPAIIYADGTEEYYIHGQIINISTINVIYRCPTYSPGQK